MMEESKTSGIYDVWSSVYDYTFGSLIRKRLRRAIGELGLKSGDRVLDLGIGTGITLDHYPQDVDVVGLDLSAGMLEKANKRVAERGMDRVRLIQGDALAPPFPPASFDHIVITHVVSVVSDPPRLMQLAAELVRPGGKVVVVNHFQSERPVAATIERWLSPVCVHLGWRSDLSLSEALQGCPLTLEQNYKLRTLDIWQVVVLGSNGATGPGSEANAPAAEAGS